jgi:hypothetical protein
VPTSHRSIAEPSVTMPSDGGMNRVPCDPQTRQGQLALLERAAALRAAARAEAQHRIDSYATLRASAAKRAAEEKEAGIEPQPMPTTVGCIEPNDVWIGAHRASPIIDLPVQSVPPSACTISVSAVRRRALAALKDPKAPHTKVNLVNVLECYAQEKAARGESILRSQNLLDRARAARKEQAEAAAAKEAARAALAAAPKPLIRRSSQADARSGLSAEQSAELIAPRLRVYDASLHSKPQVIDEQKSLAASIVIPPPSGASGEDATEVARMKARARLAANFNAIQSETIKASAAAQQANTIAHWTKTIEWYFVGLFISLWFTFVTPFTAAFYASEPYT